MQIIIFPALLDSIGIDSFYEIFCNFHNQQECLQTDLSLEIIIFPALLLDSIGIDTFYEIFCNLHNKQKCLWTDFKSENQKHILKCVLEKSRIVG